MEGAVTRTIVERTRGAVIGSVLGVKVGQIAYPCRLYSLPNCFTASSIEWYFSMYEYMECSL